MSFWVSGEMTKNKVGPKKVQCYLELIGTRLQGVCMVISYYVVGFPLVFRWFYYLKIVGLILPINFVNILLVDQNNNFWLL